MSMGGHLKKNLRLLADMSAKAFSFLKQEISEKFQEKKNLHFQSGQGTCPLRL